MQFLPTAFLSSLRPAMKLDAKRYASTHAFKASARLRKTCTELRLLKDPRAARILAMALEAEQLGEELLSELKAEQVAPQAPPPEFPGALPQSGPRAQD